MPLQLVEYAQLTTNPDVVQSNKLGIVNKATFEWLLDISREDRRAEKLIDVSGDGRIRLGSMVGYLESPDGTSIEVFPKTHQQGDSPYHARALMQKVLSELLSVAPREYRSANLCKLDTPLHEWIFSQFLLELSKLVNKGLRFDYERVERDTRFIRGQLNMAKQIRKSPEKANQFCVKYDLFTPNRIENRLIKSALDIVTAYCKASSNWRQANEFKQLLSSVPPVFNARYELRNWQSSKLLAHYHGIYPWCELILENFNPAFSKGSHRGIALMFPMERLFEDYVSKKLDSGLTRIAKLRKQVSRSYLATHVPNGKSLAKSWFQLKPDLLLENSEADRQVIDLKWKLLDEYQGNTEVKYKLHQSDFYQLFSYGHKYQNGKGHMMLIYPKYRHFNVPLAPFKLSENLWLWVVPFCMQADRLVEGGWCEYFAPLCVNNANAVVRENIS